MELNDRDVDLFRIAENFRLEARVRNVFPFGNGHINDTFKVLTGEKNYLLQRINQDVFKDVRGLMGNLVRVLNFLQDVVEKEQGSMQTLTAVRTQNGTYLYIDEAADFWRVFEFIPESHSVDKAKNPEIAEAGGKAYGWFIKNLDHFPVDDLIETIPNFHNATIRLADFNEALNQNKASRKTEAEAEIGFLLERADEMMKIGKLVENSQVPVRVTHNDTKINNVLFNENDEAICVIDLDTVMPGTVLYDFGDAIRTFANTGNEDEKDETKIEMDIRLYKGFAKGFLSETKTILQKPEIENLAFSALYITWEQAVRFLSDFIDGDLYYKTAYPGHNLIRAKAQIQLLKSMEKQIGEMEQIIEELMR